MLLLSAFIIDIAISCLLDGMSGCMFVCRLLPVRLYDACSFWRCVKRSRARLSGLRVMLLLDMSIGDGDRLLARFVVACLLTWRLHLPIWLLRSLLWLLRPSLRLLLPFMWLMRPSMAAAAVLTIGCFCLPFRCSRHHYLMTLTF